MTLSNIMIVEMLQLGIFNIGLILIASYLLILFKLNYTFKSMILVLVFGVINFISLHRGSNLIEILRGAIGDISIASVVLLCWLIFNINKINMNSKAQLPTLLSIPEKLFIIMIGWLLYLATFGIIEFDIYSMGYLTSISSFVVFVICIGILILLNKNLGWVYLLCFVAFFCNLQNSNNLWDYLVDPIMWLILLVLPFRKIKLFPNNTSRVK